MEFGESNLSSGRKGATASMFPVLLFFLVLNVVDGYAFFGTSNHWRVDTSRSAGIDHGPLGFGEALAHGGNIGFGQRTNVICGTNALEHGANLLEDMGLKTVLVVSGWNIARICPLMWELEPRQFNISTYRLEHEVSVDAVREIAMEADRVGADAIIAVGGGRVLDAVKAAAVSPILEERATAEPESGSTRSTPLFVVTVPTVPAMGAELSRYAALHVEPKSSARARAKRFETVEGVLGGENDACDAGSDQRRSFPPLTPSTDIAMKQYVATPEPDMCLVQPSLFDRLPMEIAHDRIVTLMALCVDIVLADSGFVPELLAWSALPTLVHLLDESYFSAQRRATEWRTDPGRFTERTNFDEKTNHQSQYFRRYGHALSPQDVLDLSQISATVGSAAAGAGGASPSGNGRVSALHVVADTLDASSDMAEDGFSLRCGALLPTYLDVLHEWAATETKSTEAKPATLFKLERVARILSRAQCLSSGFDGSDYGVGVTIEPSTISTSADRPDPQAFSQLVSRLKKVVHCPLTALLPVEDQFGRRDSVIGLGSDVSERQVYRLRVALKQLCPGAPLAHVEVPLLQRLVRTPELPAVEFGQGRLVREGSSTLGSEFGADDEEDVVLQQLNAELEAQQGQEDGLQQE